MVGGKENEEGGRMLMHTSWESSQRVLLFGGGFHVCPRESGNVLVAGGT